MKIRIVSDSASNLYEYPGADFRSVPMKVITDEAMYVDTPDLDVKAMMDDLRKYRGKSNTGHPGFREWQRAFGDADIVYAVTVTSKLSGSYNAALLAAEEYMEEYPDRKVFVLDSKSTGPQMELIIEKYQELIAAGKSFQEVQLEIQHYLDRTQIWWSFESLQNFVNTGRINAAVGFLIKTFGICIVGTTRDGELEPLDKIRGTDRAMKKMYEDMLKDGYDGGKVRIRHSYNEEGAKTLAGLVHKDFPGADIKVGLNRGLCGYYVEKGGVVVSFEGNRR
ncbi:MAG: DegV family protein [Blautia sp.]|nr:DegV family protein [Blautia sp.]